MSTDAPASSASIEQPHAIIILTGSELTQGTTHDTNGPFMARELHRLGIIVDELRLLPDAPRLLQAAFRAASDNADLVVVSGGLGPTEDDHTVAVLAATFGRGVEHDLEALRAMRARALRRYGSADKIPPNFDKQAEVVAGSRPLVNGNGLAPGFLFEERRALIATLPGVPHELRLMFTDQLVPVLRARFRCRPPRILRGRVLGHGESAVEARVQALGIPPELEYGISARAGEILIKLIAYHDDHQHLLDAFRVKLEAELGDDIMFAGDGDDGDPGEVDFMQLVHRRLVDAEVTVGTAESCTGGMIGKRLTDYPGSSVYYRGTIVAYQDELKGTLLGVDAEVVRAHGAVSEAVCRAMAIGARDRLDVDYALATTGIAGPGGGSDDKPVGLVFFAVADRSGHVEVRRVELPGDRGHVREQTTMRALDLLRRAVGASAEQRSKAP